MSKNMSLSNGTKMQELKNLRNDKLQSLGDENTKSKKVNTEEVVQIQVGSMSVQLLCPGKRSLSADLQVLLKEEQLAAVFDYLKADCQGNDHSRRTYQKSGKFAKGVKKDD